jgi:hypothetical protein
MELDSGTRLEHFGRWEVTEIVSDPSSNTFLNPVTCKQYGREHSELITPQITRSAGFFACGAGSIRVETHAASQ